MRVKEKKGGGMRKKTEGERKGKRGGERGNDEKEEKVREKGECKPLTTPLNYICLKKF